MCPQLRVGNISIGYPMSVAAYPEEVPASQGGALSPDDPAGRVPVAGGPGTVLMVVALEVNIAFDA